MNVFEMVQESIEGENIIESTHVIEENDDQIIENMFVDLDFMDDIEQELYSESFENIIDTIQTRVDYIEDDIYSLEDILSANTELDYFLDSNIELDEIGPSMEFQIDLLKLERMFNISERILKDEDLAEEYAETLALDEEEGELTTEDYIAFIDENIEELIDSYEARPISKQETSLKKKIKNITTIVNRRQLDLDKIDSKIKKFKNELNKTSGTNIKAKINDKIKKLEIDRKTTSNKLISAKTALSKAKTDLTNLTTGIKGFIGRRKESIQKFGQSTKKWIGSKFKKTDNNIKNRIKKGSQKTSDFIKDKTGVRIGKGAPDPNKGLKKLPSGFFARIIVRIRLLLRRIKRAFGKFSSGLSETKILQWVKSKHNKMNETISNKTDGKVTTKRVGIGALIIGFLTALFVVLRRSSKWDVNYNQQVSKLSGINNFNGDKKAKIISKRELDSAITGCKNILKNASEATKAMTSGELDIRSKFDQSDFAAVGISMTGSGGTKISKKSRSRQSLNEHGYTDGDLQKYKRDHSEIHNLYMKWTRDFSSSLPNGGFSAYKFISNSTRDAYLATMTNLYATLIKFG